jgi:hypothetical protein
MLRHIESAVEQVFVTVEARPAWLILIWLAFIAVALARM